MKTENIQDIYELTPLQQGILFHSLYAPDTAVYFVQLGYSLRGKLDAIAFERAWQTVVARQTILRTAFYWEDLEKPLQVVNKNVNLVLQQYNWRDKNIEEQKQQLQEFLESDRAKGFDFSQAPLMRLSLIRCADDVYYFIWSKHHLILDGWSTALVLKEVVEIYQAIAQGKEFSLVSKTDYKDYIKWLQKQDASQTQEFWRQLLKGFKTPTSLKAIEGDRLSIKEKKYEKQAIKLAKTTTEILQSLARSHKLTLNAIVQAAWAILLGCYSSQEDVVFGVTVSGRPTDLLGAETMVGMFINTLPIRVKLKAETHLLSLLLELQKKQLEINQYQHSSLVDVQSWSEIAKGTPLFESIFVFENYPIDETLKERQENLEIKSISSFDNSNYPLTITVIPGSELEIAIAYDCERFESATINRMLGHFQTLLVQMSEGFEISLKDLTLLTTSEQNQLLREWNDTEIEYPQNKCIHQLFEEQVKKTPDAIAVVFEEQQLTYKELNDRANQLAHYLHSLGVKAEMMVGICLERSLEMAIAILGVLKAGGVYIPVDPNYPTERITDILKDAQVSVILTQQHLKAKLSSLKIAIVPLDRNWLNILQDSSDNCLSEVNAENLAYVIYTSGSTGKPKGVAVSHQALVNYTLDIAEQFKLQACDRVLQFASIGFDVVVEELFPTWSRGATVVLLEHKQLISCSEFQQLIAKQQLTVFELPTAYWHQWVSELSQSQETVPNCVRLAIVGGERISNERLRQWQTLQTPLIHVYGLTETSVTSTVYHLNSDAETLEEGVELPIGRPIANTQIYLLDSYLQLVPIGVAGEIYIGGEGIARGYLNRSKLTAEKFIPNLFSQTPGARLYKTGDKAKYRKDGSIEYIGRIDYQVKLRGFRIELGEIESTLNRYSKIRDCVVINQENFPGEKRLVAYLVTEKSQQLGIEQLRSFLKQRLPEYMIPSAFVILETLPLTFNGKVNRQVLSASNAKCLELEKTFVAPRTPFEKIIASIWQKVFNLEQVGIYDNFFDLGGDSIICLQVIFKTKEAGLYLTPKQIFQHQTIAEIATVASTIEVIQAEQNLVTGSFNFTPIQHWFFEQNFANFHHWNQAVLLKINQNINPETLEKAVQKLVKHHDILRFKLIKKSSKYQPIIADVESEQMPSLIQIDLSAISSELQITALETAAEQIQVSLNLLEGKTLRMVLFNLGNNQPKRFLCVIHHLIVDGVSWRILLEDLEKAYQQLKRKESIQLPPKTTSFKQWSYQLQKYAQSPVLQSELNYWSSRLFQPVNPLPVDYLNGDNLVTSAKTISVALNKEETRLLLQEIPAVYRTQINDVLLTALVQTFSQWMGKRTLLVDLEGNGREELFDNVDLSRTVGWFTSLFPVLLDLERTNNPGENLKVIKEQLHNIPNRGIGYSLLRYLSEDENSVKRLHSLPKAEVIFNYLGQFDQILSKSSIFKLASESSGLAQNRQNYRSYLLEINSIIIDNQLRCNWIYNQNIHRQSTINSLAQGFLEALRKLIVHCQSPEAGGFTPSDLPLLALNQEELDTALQKISF
jgi:amino acid adenylation domain-containing protein/non-ribosomal peptide synthase protein (TIGR01720 family)